MSESDAPSAPDITDPSYRCGVLRAALEHVSFQITDALVWLPSAGAYAIKGRAILIGTRAHIANKLAQFDEAETKK